MADDDTRQPGQPGNEALEDRDDAQEEQLEAQKRGDITAELGGFIKEVVSDQKKFPSDVKQDAEDPARRVDEEQGTPEHPAHEPGSG